MKNSSNKHPIDFVILWVDGNDEKWKKEKKIYSEKKLFNTSNRFRDWDNMQYLFRGIEKYADFVRNIYFITYGHTPKWMNLNHPKLKIIKHKSFIPVDFLPTYNSNVIVLNLHRIVDLSENFVLFNDDLFIMQPLEEKDFFEDDKPKDFFIEENKTTYSERYLQLKSNITKVLEKYFSKCDYDYLNIHLTQPFNKNIFVKLWKENESELNQSCLGKFRSDQDIGRNIFRYYSLLSTEYKNYKIKGKYFAITNDNREIIKTIKDSNYKLICLNDACEEIDYEKAKEDIKEALSTKFREKSTYEI